MDEAERGGDRTLRRHATPRLRCRLLGHQYRFTADGLTMRWRCERGCEGGGSKRYPSAEEARRYAAAFDRTERDQLGRRAPIGLSPLRLLRALRARRR
jgi:hypothetical protein